MIEEHSDLAAAPLRAVLDDATVEAATGDPERQIVIWDRDAPGFCLRIHPSGAKAFCVKYISRGEARWYTIGVPGRPWSADDARGLARDVRMAVACGRDPAVEKQTAKRELTVADLIDRYLSEGPLTKIDKRASSWASDESSLRRHLKVLLGDRPLSRLTRTDVATAAKGVLEGETATTVKTRARGAARVRGGLGAARRTLQTTAAMFAWAIEQELMTHNPAKGVRLPRAAARGRFLSQTEADHLLAVLAGMERARKVHRRFASVIRLLLFTGARKSEILALRWSEVNWADRQIVLAPDRSKTGGKVGERRIPLSDAALGVLRSLPQTADYVFPGGRQSKNHTTGLQKVWHDVRAAAGFPNLRVHDLRHSFASLALANNENLYLISRVLGHTTTRMTERYLHANDSDLQALVQRTTAIWATSK
ncbi:MAG TPA: site-specific integrase [Caulobacteraceae bacterium]|nr:site-specific integrase [Caulobacteraceae bacterium]